MPTAMMIGLPVDEDGLQERFFGEPKPRGPKPILKMPTKAGAGESADAGESEDTGLAPGMQLIGKPGPHDRRYALGS